MKRYIEYSGMGYERASREAERLVKLGWFRNFDRLSALKQIMDRHLATVARAEIRELIQRNAYYYEGSA